MRTTHEIPRRLHSDASRQLALDAAEGLSRDPKRIPSRYLYDDLGSKLFEAICELPWYKITRAERGLLSGHAESIVSGLGGAPTIIELGAGNGEKLSLLLEHAGLGQRGANVHLVDVSSAALERSGQALSRYDDVMVVSHEASYEDGLVDAVSCLTRPEPVLLLFLGSNIGNMSREESARFLQLVRDRCRAGDRLLLGADLVKPEAELLMAYDDPLGVTAAFNRNLLARLNRELDGDFDLGAYDHRVVWNPEASRVESYLVSRDEQRVSLRGAACSVLLADGEAIWTESSHKYEPEEVLEMGDRASFAVRHQWIEPEARFSLTLFEAISSSR